MTAATIRKHRSLYRSLDRLAEHAFETGDIRKMDHYLDARNEIAAVLRVASHAEWFALHLRRFSPPPRTPTAHPAY